MKFAVALPTCVALSFLQTTTCARLTYLPMVDLRMFLNFTEYIWTYVGTTPNTFCKVDHVVYGIYKEAMFYRNVSGLRRRMYKGTYVDTDTGRFSTSYPYGPTVMQLSSPAERQEFTEQIVYQDTESLCGIFLTFPDTPLSNKYTHNKYDRWTACELRMKGNRKGPYHTPACFSVFNELCGRNTYKIFGKQCSE